VKKLVGPALLAGLLAFAYFAPFGTGWPCPLRMLVGIPCPACGMTRAVRLVVAGDFAGATHMHPLVWVAVPVVAAFLTVEVIGFVRTREWGASRRVRGSTAVMVATAVLMFAVWIARFLGAFGGLQGVDSRQSTVDSPRAESERT